METSISAVVWSLDRHPFFCLYLNESERKIETMTIRERAKKKEKEENESEKVKLSNHKIWLDRQEA